MKWNQEYYKVYDNILKNNVNSMKININSLNVGLNHKKMYEVTTKDFYGVVIHTWKYFL